MTVCQCANVRTPIVRIKQGFWAVAAAIAGILHHRHQPANPPGSQAAKAAQRQARHTFYKSSLGLATLTLTLTCNAHDRQGWRQQPVCPGWSALQTGCAYWYSHAIDAWVTCSR